jgi:hypothetical protein
MIDLKFLSEYYQGILALLIVSSVMYSYGVFFYIGLEYISLVSLQDYLGNFASVLPYIFAYLILLYLQFKDQIFSPESERDAAWREARLIWWSEAKWSERVVDLLATSWRFILMFIVSSVALFIFVDFEIAGIVGALFFLHNVGLWHNSYVISRSHFLVLTSLALCVGFMVHAYIQVSSRASDPASIVDVELEKETIRCSSLLVGSFGLFCELNDSKRIRLIRMEKISSITKINGVDRRGAKTLYDLYCNPRRFMCFEFLLGSSDSPTGQLPQRPQS